MASQDMGSKAVRPAHDGAERKVPTWRAVLARIMRVREAALVGFILVVSLVLTLLTPTFLTTQNMRVILTGLALDAVIAVGMTMVLVSGGVDLSVGSVFACSGIVVAKLFNLGLPAWAAVSGAILVALFWGFFSGFLITKVGISPLISTLGVMGMARGVVYVITSGRVLAGLPDGFQHIGQGTTLGVPNVIWLAAIVVIAGDFLLRRSRVLRQVFYIGGNERAARLSGINVNRVKLGVYILIALLCGIAGIMETSRFASAISPMGTGKELTAISACVIGGASMAGGEGTVLGGFLGLFLLGLIRDGLILNDVSVYWQQLIQAAILVLAVAFDVLTRRRRRV